MWKRTQEYIVGLVDIGLCWQHNSIAMKEIRVLEKRMNWIIGSGNNDDDAGTVSKVEKWIRDIVTRADVRKVKANSETLERRDNSGDVNRTSDSSSESSPSPARIPSPDDFKPHEPDRELSAHLQNLPPRAAVSKLLHELPDSEIDHGYYIYLYSFKSLPSFIKIGLSGKSVEKRLDEHARDCGHTPQICKLLFIWPSNHAKRVEKLVHTLLKNRWKKLPCELCEDSFHTEWFAIEESKWEQVKTMVLKFALLMDSSREPYEYNHKKGKFKLKDERVSEIEPLLNELMELP